jgi:hypothetical protein
MSEGKGKQERELPPDEINRTLGGERKAVYSKNADGSIGLVPSKGNTTEEAVTRQALEEFQRQSRECRQRVKAGLASTLEYHMYEKRMDLTTLAQSSGIFRWRVRRHLRPDVFRKLKPALQTLYAEALGLSREELNTLPPKPAVHPDSCADAE